MEKTARVVRNDNLVRNIYKMTIDMGECDFSHPGQYAMIEACGCRRPYQVCDFDSNRFTIVFPAEDNCSRILSSMKLGDEVLVEAGLGNGFDLDKVPQNTYLVADDMGVPEMLGLARGLLMRGVNCKLVLSYPSKRDIYMLDSFRHLVNEIEVLTLDGSNGREGVASDVVKKAPYVLASGSIDMLRKLADKVENGQFSMSSTILANSADYDDCFIETTEGRLNCSDAGPVFDMNIINWDEIR
jgi:dihydroorotate dehydrogenase electron transfer subunit